MKLSHSFTYFNHYDANSTVRCDGRNTFIQRRLRATVSILYPTVDCAGGVAIFTPLLPSFHLPKLFSESEDSLKLELPNATIYKIRWKTRWLLRAQPPADKHSRPSIRGL